MENNPCPRCGYSKTSIIISSTKQPLFTGCSRCQLPEQDFESFARCYNHTRGCSMCKGCGELNYGTERAIPNIYGPCYQCRPNEFTAWRRRESEPIDARLEHIVSTHKKGAA